MQELQQLMSSDTVMPVKSSAHPACRMAQTLRHIRLATGDNHHALRALFQPLDHEGRGFVPQAEFKEVLRSVPWDLSPEARSHLAAFFSAACEPNWVCYPHFLQSVMPVRSEGSGVALTAVAMNEPRQWWQPESHGGHGYHCAPWVEAAASPAQLDQLARTLRLENENQDLRVYVQRLEAQCKESASQLLAQEQGAPATAQQAVRHLQADIAALENRVLEQQTALLTGSRRAEITLRGDLEVCQHEKEALRRALDVKEQEVDSYRRELEVIITELTELQRAQQSAISNAGGCSGDASHDPLAPTGKA